jgi:hypothetical protein
VQVNLDPSEQGQVKRGDRAQITLPGNTTVTGKVVGFGRTAQAPAGQDSSAADATIPTYIRLDDPGKARGLDRASVQVQITTKGVHDALSVPVTALVGKAGGGFAVEVVRAGERRELVAVNVGVFDTTDGLAIIMRQKHSQFPGPGRREDNVIGTPLWPAYALRALAMMFATTGLQYGPYEPYLGTNGAQPDWYMGWLIGALRLTPGFDVTVGDYTLVPNSFIGGVLFPTVVFGVLYAWPAIERRITKDHRRHDLLDRPRDVPWRTAFGAAFFTWLAVIFLAGAADRLLVDIGFPCQSQVWYFRVLAVALPIAVFFLVRRICRELRASEARPLRAWTGTLVRRTPDGAFQELGEGSRPPAPDERAQSPGQ